MNLEEIYEAYFKDVFLFLRSLSASADIAEEIAQETFTKALQSIDRFDGRKDIKAWLFTIARNTYYTYCRRQKLAVDEDNAAQIPAPQVVFIDKIVDEDDAFLVHHFLHNMKEPYKEVFTLRVFGELSFEKIGLLFGKTANWARVTFYRSKKQIVDYLKENGYGKD